MIRHRSVACQLGSTLPAELRDIAYDNPKLVHHLLFMSMGAVLSRTDTINGSDLGGLYKSIPGSCVRADHDAAEAVGCLHCEDATGTDETSPLAVSRHLTTKTSHDRGRHPGTGPCLSSCIVWSVAGGTSLELQRPWTARMTHRWFEWVRLS